MQVVLHQIKHELRARRPLFVAWLAIQIALALLGLTGLAGEFYRAQTSPLIAQIQTLLDLAVALGIVLLPGTIALADSPTDESAHWNALPVRPWQLLIAKLLTVFLAVALPMTLLPTLTLLGADAGRWIPHLLWDRLGHLPAWMAVGFAVGSMTGNWRRFAVALAALMVGLMLAMFAVENWVQHSYIDSGAGMFQEALENALEHCNANNLLLLGAVIAILLRYFSRVHGAWLGALFVAGIPATVALAPALTSSLLPDYEGPQTVDRSKIKVAFELPGTILTVTNNGSVRWHGFVPYTGLAVEGLSRQDFLLPVRLNTGLWTHNEARNSFTNIAQDWFPFPGRKSFEPGKIEALHFMERSLTLAGAVPDLQIINPPVETSHGFNLFNIAEQMALRNDGARLRLTTELHAQPGRYVKVGELPLRVGAAISTNGTAIRIAALRLDAGDKTQIKVNIRHVRFETEEDNAYSREYMDDRRRPASLRYILVNDSRREACLRSDQPWSWSRRAYPLGFQSTVLNYAVAEGRETDRPLDSGWLKDAQLHVFRALPTRPIAITNTVEDIDIFAIPRQPVPRKIEIKYR